MTTTELIRIRELANELLTAVNNAIVENNSQTQAEADAPFRNAGRNGNYDTERTVDEWNAIIQNDR